MKRTSRPGWVKELALHRIEKLLKLAEQNVKKHPERARRYVELAKKLSSKYNATMPRELKKKFCRKCDAFLVHGRNLAVRVKAGMVEYTCLECGAKRKYSYGHNKHR